MYAYGLNNPVNNYDPTGNFAREIPTWSVVAQSPAVQSFNNFVDTVTTAKVQQSVYTRGNVSVVTNTNVSVPKGNIKVVDGRYDNPENPFMQVKDSYKVTSPIKKIEVINVILNYTKQNPTGLIPEWSRSMPSLLIEWDIHNIGYDIGKFLGRESWIESGRNADLDNNAIIRRPFAVPFK